MADSLSRTFAHYVAGLHYEVLPIAVVDNMALVIIMISLWVLEPLAV